jgi:4'-phosphopantetheinyl transferase
MRNTVRQLHCIIELWSQKYDLSGAIVELPAIYMNPEKFTHYFRGRELESLNTISNRKRKVSRIAGRLAARVALRKFDPEHFSDYDDVPIEIINNEDGKPCLVKNSDISVSISHSGACAIAVVSKMSVGVDIELMENRPDSFVNTYFSLSEQQWIRKTDKNFVNRANCLWTRKEAVSKLLGIGGALQFKSIPVLDDESNFNFESHLVQQYCLSLALEKEITS